MRKIGLFLVAAIVLAFLLTPLLAFGQVPDAGVVVQPLPADPAQLAVRAVEAAATNDWRVLAVALLALVGFLVRNLASAEGKLGAFLQSKWGALLVLAVSAAVGAAVPALQGGVAVRGVVVSAVAGAAGALCGWLTPAPAAKVVGGATAVLVMLVPSLALADMGPMPFAQIHAVRFEPFAIAGLWTGVFLTAAAWRHVERVSGKIARSAKRWSVVGVLALLMLGGCAPESAMEAGAMACAFIGGAVGVVLLQRIRARFLWCLFALALAAPVAGCGASTKTIVATTAIATVQTVDQGIETFTTWAVHEEDRIASAAIAGCSDRRTVDSYKACTDTIVTPRRTPIDKAKSAIRIYRQALAAGGAVAAGDIANAAAAVVGALAAVGITVGGG